MRELWVPSNGYYLREAEVTARMALAESDPDKTEALHMLALKYFEKAEKSEAGGMTPAYQIPKAAKNRDLGSSLHASDDPYNGYSRRRSDRLFCDVIRKRRSVGTQAPQQLSRDSASLRIAEPLECLLAARPG
jgi:hypothetical protein